MLFGLPSEGRAGSNTGDHMVMLVWLLKEAARVAAALPGVVQPTRRSLCIVRKRTRAPAAGARESVPALWPGARNCRRAPELPCPRKQGRPEVRT